MFAIGWIIFGIAWFPIPFITNIYLLYINSLIIGGLDIIAYWATALTFIYLLPGQPGLSTFCSGLAFDLGPVAMGFFLQYTANPKNLKAHISVQEGDISVNYFDEKITDNLFTSFSLLSGYIILGGI